MMENESYMVACDMGIGKTGAALTAVSRMLEIYMANHVLIIAPLLVAEETWPEEIEVWDHLRWLDYEVLTGPPDRRENRARLLASISIINRENVGWLVALWGDDWPYDVVVIDEISSFKNHVRRNKPTKKVVKDATEQAIASLPAGATELEIENKVKRELRKVRGELTRFGSLAKVRNHIDRVYGLTGTISPNGLTDLWSQYYLLDQGHRLHSTISKYRSRWFDRDYMGYNFVPKQGAFQQITERISDITISMKTEDFTDMPPIVYNTIPVRLPKKIMAAYKKFETTLLYEEHDVEAVNRGVLTGKLLQLSNGSIYDEDGEAIEIHSLKLEALDRVIEEAAGEPVLVAYSYQFDLAKLKKRYPQAEVAGEAKNLQKRWNAGEIPILLAHPQSAGHGLNLQYGGCVTVWYGLCWSLEYYQQLNKRLHRPGQTNTVFVHHLVAEGTMDERVMRVLPDKDATQSAVIDATRWVPS